MFKNQSNKKKKIGISFCADSLKDKMYKIDSKIDIKSSIKKTIRMFANVSCLSDLSLPLQNEELNVWTDKNTNPSKLLNEESSNIIFFASSINEKYIKYLTNAKCVVGHHFKKFHTKEYQLLNNPKVRLNHAKILAYKKGKDNIVVVGSGNLSINARGEFYKIYNCKKMYDLIEKVYNNV